MDLRLCKLDESMVVALDQMDTQYLILHLQSIYFSLHISPKLFFLLRVIYLIFYSCMLFILLDLSQLVSLYTFYASIEFYLVRR